MLYNSWKAKITPAHIVFVFWRQGDCIVLFTAKTGCEAIKNKHHLQTLESIPKLAVGRPKKPSGYLVDTPRSSKDNKKQRKCIKTRTPNNKDKSSPIIDLICAPI